MPILKDGWQQIHTALIVIGLAVSMTVGALTFFVWADDFKQFKGEIYVYQIEDQALRANDRIIELNRELDNPKLNQVERSKKTAEKQKLEKRVEYLEKKMDAATKREDK